MRAMQGSGTLFRALSVLLTILSLAILVASMLLIASETSAHFPLLRELFQLLSGEADVSRSEVTAVVIVLLGAVALPLAIVLLSTLFRDVRIREQQYAVEIDQHQKEIQVLHGTVNRLADANRTQAAWLDQSNERIDAAAKTGREISTRLQDGSRFESAHLLAAGRIITEVTAVMDEMEEYAGESAAVANESMQMVADETCATTRPLRERFYYLADLSRRMAQVAQKQSGSVAGVGKSVASVSEISHRSAASAALLLKCSADLKSLAEELRQIKCAEV